jgi:hypothetical protein
VFLAFLAFLAASGVQRAESTTGVAADGDPQGEPAGGVVVADLELEAVEQVSLEVCWQGGDIDIGHWELIE